VRTGAYALSLLAVPLHVHVLRALEAEPLPLVELRRRAGLPSSSTLRGHLRTLSEIGVVERRRRPDLPGSVDYAIGEHGPELLGVAETLQAWLAASPQGPLELGSEAGRSAIKALAEGWSSSMIRGLAAKPLTLTELDSLIVDVSYPSLERRLEAMRMVGQIERSTSSGRGTPYAVTEWLRKAIAPIIAAVHWERIRLPAETAAITRIDVEAAFMLSVPMVTLPADLSGTSRLAVQMDGNNRKRLAGVMVEVAEGRIESCVSRLEGNAIASATGSATSWIQAVTEQKPDRLAIGGEHRLAASLVEGLHDVLFGALLGP
jgi:DNA-binding HxlR family transcriptional regulator